jgi:hypothetical protein
MSSTLLQQAVQLAQAGQKAEARQLILQFLQTEPNNETAWLWLASVAADQTEYQRALNEVLRINPGSQRAKQLLADFEQQYGSAARYAPPVTPPPQVSPYAPPQQPVSTPPPQVSPYAMQQPVSPPPPPPVSGVQYSPPAPVEVKVKTERRRGCLGCSLPGCGCLGCGGCGQGCILAFLVLVILPAIVCGALSTSSISLGPFDFFANFLPGEMGRKEIKFTTDTYDISLDAPRSWYLAQTNDQMWTFWSNALDNTLPFAEAGRKWSDLESYPGVAALIVDTDPVALNKGGDAIYLALLPGSVSEDFGCSAVRAKFAGVTNDYQQVFDYGNGLCGYRDTDEMVPGPTTPVFKSIDAPGMERKIMFYTPVNSTTGLKWQISIPEVIYNWKEVDTKDDIQTLIGSVKVTAK